MHILSLLTDSIGRGNKRKWLDRISNSGPLAFESVTLLTALPCLNPYFRAVSLPLRWMFTCSGEGPLPFCFCVPYHWGSLLLERIFFLWNIFLALTLWHSKRPKLYTILAFLSAIGLRKTKLYTIWAFLCAKGLRVELFHGGFLFNRSKQEATIVVCL